VGSFGVAGGFDLLICLLGESDAEHSEDVSILGLGLYESLNERVPFLNHGAGFVSGDVHSVEIGVAVESFNLINLELELSPVVSLSLVVAVGEGSCEDTTSQTISGVHQTGGLIAWSQRDASLVESWSENIVPLFLGEWVSTKIEEKVRIWKTSDS